MKRIFAIAIALLSATVLADAAIDFVKARRRIINREIVGDSAIYTYAQGSRTWTETNTVKHLAARVGPIKYSKLKLIVAAKAAGKWDAVKAAIQAMDLEDEWQACQFITSDYPAYVAATNAVISQGIATDADVKAFMRQAED
jgi:hypothetical protein